MGEGGMAGCGFSAFSLDSKDPTQPYRLNHPFTQQPQNRPLVSSSIRTFFQKQSLIHSNLDFLAAEFWVVGGTTWLLDILRFTYKVKFHKEVEAEELASPFSFSTKRSKKRRSDQTETTNFARIAREFHNLVVPKIEPVDKVSLDALRTKSQSKKPKDSAEDDHSKKK
nr:uncharacterized protein LOC103427590 isoform X1 [Malus domestica]